VRNYFVFIFQSCCQHRSWVIVISYKFCHLRTSFAIEQHNDVLHFPLWATLFLLFENLRTAPPRDAGAAVWQGGEQKSWGQWKLIKKQKYRYQLCLFLFSKNVDLTNI